MQKWTKELTTKLINIIHHEYYDKFIEFENHSQKLNGFYNEITQKISPEGKVSGEDCRHKYNKLKCKFNEQHDVFRTSGAGGGGIFFPTPCPGQMQRRKCPMYRHLDSILTK